MVVMNQKRSLLSRIGRWTAELVLVFVSVYAAFWLNNYQQHRLDAERRDQILAALEQQMCNLRTILKKHTRHCSDEFKPNDSAIINIYRHYAILREAKNLRSILDLST